MRIAVLFGSFNPLTCAHLTAMKKAVEHLNADKGLFVATNGQYLRRKTVKLDDPFYLSEEERKEIIERVCEKESALSFWGYELGGFTPRRYTTLRRIQSQYPDAEVFEVQGADKVSSISKFSDGEEYVSHIRFAVFARNGTELDGLLESDALLRQYKDRFLPLPPLDGLGEVSSTEVRRRFFAGEDFSDIVPEAVVEVLKRHAPSDFTISFSLRMQTLMRSGRFGVNAAQKEVYAENTKLFLRWRDGSREFDFGDYRDFLDRTEIYRAALDTRGMGTVSPSTETGCINMDCVDLAEHLLSKGYRPAILNLASATKPGGGYAEGLSAQEESLCRSSNLSLSLYQYADPKRLKCVRESGVPHKGIGYPLDTNYGGIYTPNVTFFRNNKFKFFTLKQTPFSCDVITVAALSFNGRSGFSRACEQDYRSADGGFTPEGEGIMLNKIRTVFRLGVLHGRDALILGAFGCGAYRLPASHVARLFRRVMDEPEFAGKFRQIPFAILEPTARPNGLYGKFSDFYHTFGAYRLP